MKKELVDQFMPIANSMRLYHRHEVHGLDNIPESGPALLVVNHSLATYDIILLFAAIYHKKHRITRPLIDRLFYKLPGLGQLVEELGATQGSPDSAVDLLKEGNIVCVAPGGMREALRPSTERYQILWDRRLGFAKVAMQAGAPVILAACPRADDIYEVYPSRLTKWVYQNFRVPLMLARGVGPTPIPRPVKLMHFVSEPLIPPKASDNPAVFRKQVAAFHAKIVKRMQELIGEAIAYRPDREPPVEPSSDA